MLDAFVGFASRYIHVILLSSIVSTGALLGLRFVDLQSYRVRTRTLLFPLVGSFLLTLWISPSCFAHWLSLGEGSPAHIVCNDPSFAQVRSICTGWVIMSGVSFVLATMQGAVSYLFSDGIIGRIHRVNPLEPGLDESLADQVKELSYRASITPPGLRLIESSKLQIFSLGRKARSNIYVSVGLMEALTDEEMEAAFGHEIAHIRNGDSFLRAFASSLRLAAMFNVLSFIIEPAISRDREFLADEEGSRLTGKPHALASALLKLSDIPSLWPETGMMGSLPMGLITPRSRISRFFDRHPPLEERLRRLLELEK